MEPVPHFPNRAWAPGQEVERRGGGFANLVRRLEGANPVFVQFGPDRQPFREGEIQSQPEGEDTVHEDVDPLWVPLLGRDRCHATARRPLPAWSSAVSRPTPSAHRRPASRAGSRTQSTVKTAASATARMTLMNGSWVTRLAAR